MVGLEGDRRMATKTAPKPTETEPQRRATQEPAPGARGVSSPIKDYLAALHAKYAGLDDGQVATYIPELAKADPSWFGICVATTDGHVYEVGDTAQPFTIQSISKPFVYGLALEDHGRDAVLEEGRRRADRRRVQLDQPRAGDRAAAQPDDQRRRDRDHVADRGRRPATRSCSGC